MKLSEYVTQVINHPKYGRDIEWVRANLHRAHIENIEATHDAEVRAGVVAEEPEWEYGISYAAGNEEFEGQDLPTIQRRVKYIRRQKGYYSASVHAVRRRPAGDSSPVKQEGAGRG
jgi:hypothetical protein